MTTDMDELSAEDLERMVRKRVATLGRHAQEAQEEIERCRAEAEKLTGLLEAMGGTVDVPEALQGGRKTKRGRKRTTETVTCDVCGGVFNASGINTHKTRQHGKA